MGPKCDLLSNGPSKRHWATNSAVQAQATISVFQPSANDHHARWANLQADEHATPADRLLGESKLAVDQATAGLSRQAMPTLPGIANSQGSSSMPRACGETTSQITRIHGGSCTTSLLHEWMADLKGLATRQEEKCSTPLGQTSNIYKHTQWRPKRHSGSRNCGEIYSRTYPRGHKQITYKTHPSQLYISNL